MSSDHFPDTLKKALRWESHRARAIFLSGLIVAIGCCASAALWTIGIKGAKHDQELQFVKQADELITAIQTTWQEFSVVGLWMQEECHGHEDSEFLKWTSCSREDFAELYEFVSSSSVWKELLVVTLECTASFWLSTQSLAALVQASV